MWRLSTDVMLVARFDGTIIAVNPAWTSLLGWREEELLGRSFMDLVHPDDLAATQAEAGRLSEGFTTLRFENRYRCKDGSHRWLSWIAVPEEEHIHAVGRDVQAEKEAAEALRETEEALRQAQKMEAVGQLTGGIAHDFNNLLAGIVGSLDLMQTRIAQGRTENIERYAKAAMSSAQRAAALTHRLLAFSRRQPLDPKPVNANQLVTSMEDMLRRTIGPMHALEIVTAGGLWTTLCDPNQLESAILNLVINARDAMPDGGKLTIETCNAHLDDAYTAGLRDVSPGQYVCLCVTDTGTGMSSEVATRAFEPFFTTKPLGQGTGLGLSMVYGFAKQSEGHLKIYSEVGQGTTIKIYLPRHRGAAVEEGHSSAVAVPPRADAGETVLVVEDEPVVRDLIVEVLGDLGYRALAAADGPSGLKILQSRERIDLVVTDVGLPGLNGRQLADHARETRPKLKVLFITGYAENATLAAGFLEPGMEMITKPFAVEALATKVKAMIRGVADAS
jgi:PAS domain S-box-containing protein